MRKIREVLRLRHEQGLSHQAVAQACAVGVGTVNRYLQRAAQRGLGWPLPAALDDAGLDARLFPRAAPVHDRIRPDCAYIHRELKRNGVTLQLLWEEYAQVHPDGYRRTQFCEIYRQWAGRLRPSMRQVHRAGEKTFIDFSGKRPTLVDRRTGELRPVELFVAVLGASSFTYVEATETQQLPDWVNVHIRMVEYFGGATALWIPDQLKSAITRPCRYEPDVNRTYEDLAAHYGSVVVPARPRKPWDKAAVENCVLIPAGHGAARNTLGIVLLAAWCGTAACATVGPDYVRPESPLPDGAALPDAWRAQALSGLDTGEARLQRWWELFDDATLVRLVERAQTANPDVRLAVARVLESRAIVGVAAGESLPFVDTTGGVSVARGSAATLPFGVNPEIDTLTSVGVDLSWELDLFGRIARSIEAGVSRLYSVRYSAHSSSVMRRVRRASRRASAAIGFIAPSSVGAGRRVLRPSVAVAETQLVVRRGPLPLRRRLWSS